MRSRFMQVMVACLATIGLVGCSTAGPVSVSVTGLDAGPAEVTLDRASGRELSVLPPGARRSFEVADGESIRVGDARIEVRPARALVDAVASEVDRHGAMIQGRLAGIDRGSIREGREDVAEDLNDARAASTGEWVFVVRCVGDGTVSVRSVDPDGRTSTMTVGRGGTMYLGGRDRIEVEGVRIRLVG